MAKNGKKSGNPAVRHQVVPAVGEITSAKSWGDKSRQEGFAIELPSGEIARVRRTLDLPSLLEGGLVPNPLSDILKKIIAESGGELTLEVNMSDHDGGTEAAMQFMAMVDQQMPRIFIEPKVVIPPPVDDERYSVWECPEDAIRIDQLDLQDKLYVYRFAQGGPLGLARFRRESQTVMAVVLDGEDDEDEAESAGGAD